MKQSKQAPKKGIEFHINLQTVFIAIFAFFIVISLLSGFENFGKKDIKTVPMTTVLEDIKQKKIKTVDVLDTEVKATYMDGKEVQARKEAASSFFTIMSDAGVNALDTQVTVKDVSPFGFWINILINIVPTLLMVAFFVFLFRQARGAQDSIFSFGQSRAKRFQKGKSKITFKDVAGIKEAKEELAEVVDFLKFPDKYKLLGARTPKGVLLVGPAGVGKTLLAKAIAGEANVAFFSIAGSEFMEMLVGIGAARVRDLFKNAKINAPSIIFIDEIDAIGRTRSTGVMGGHDEREQTLNQILVEMDGFEPTEKVIVIAATNRGDLLDSALMRPGRFDRRVVIQLPDLEERTEILKLHSAGKPIAADVDWNKLAKRTVGYSGADLENMLNEGAILAARNALKEIPMEMLEEAATKVKLGPEKRRMQTEEDKKITAYHEAGHAIVSYAQPDMDPVHRISIVARGMSLGHTLIPPKADTLHEKKSRLLAQLAMTLGGRAAEEIVFKDVTTGASNDFNQATAIARAMVTEFGMSSLGPINMSDDMDITDWRRMGNNAAISQELQAKVDKEVAAIINTAYKQALTIVQKNRPKLKAVAEALLEKETLDQEAFEAIMKKSTPKTS